MEAVLSEQIIRLNEETTQLVHTMLPVFLKHWSEMYTVGDGSLIVKYADTISSHIHNLFADFETDIIQKKNQLLSDVEKKLNEMKKLEKELDVNIDHHISPEGPINERSKSLDMELNGYRQLRAKRMDQLNRLRQKELTLCDQLAELRYSIPNAVPSEQQLEELAEHCHLLQKLKVERQGIYVDVKSKLQTLMSTLEIEPSTPFLWEVVNSDVETFKLTSTKISLLNVALDQMENSVRETEYEVAQRLDKLNHLWDLIEESESHRKSFLRRNNGIGKRAREAILEEIERCEALKRANMIPVIMKLRSEIRGLWDRLAYSEEQRRDFHAFNTDALNEHVLQLHELELASLEASYEQNKTILELANKRKELCEKMEHFQKLATDPKRLKNRGGQLLREEKERKALEKSLPRVDSQLKNLLVSYYEQHDQPFLWHGIDLLQTITTESNSSQTSSHSRCTTPRTPCHRNSRISYFTSSTITDPERTNESVSSYSQFQIELRKSATKAIRPTPSRSRTPIPSSVNRLLTPGIRSSSRLPLRQIQPSLNARAHSSPTTPKRLATKFKPSPRRVVTPRRFGLSVTRKNSLHF